MAERVGFEPTYPVKGNLISSQARYGQLRYLSAWLVAAVISAGPLERFLMLFYVWRQVKSSG